MSPNAQAAGDAAGYRHPGYAASLSEFGTPRPLPLSGGWLLEREVAGSPYRDAMGCYPLFACADWSALPRDLDAISGEVVCVSAVTDPFGGYDADLLRRSFTHRVVPFKRHFVADLSRPVGEIVSKHHQYYARRSLSSVRVERCDEPSRFLDEWAGLYGHLASRHGLTGIKAFSRAAFEAQLRVPGIVMLRATCEGEAVGAHLWYVDGEVAHSHLAALSPRGYELMASYALYWHALNAFAGEARWLNFGAGAGLEADASDGLTRFKRGWATDSATAYFCARIFDEGKYAEIMAARGVAENDYFPAYRAGEFG